MMTAFDPASTSVWLRAGFVAVATSLTLFWVWAWTLTTTGRRKAGAGAAVVLAAWLAVTSLLGSLPLFHSFESFPPPLLRVFMAMLVLIAVFAFSSLGKRLSHALPLWVLVGFQAFRIPVELLLHRSFHEGLIGVQMTYLGRNFDVVTGVSALLLGAVMYKRVLPKSVLWLWNIVGVGLLLNIVGIAALSMPTPKRLFMEGPANVFVAYLPFIWLPTVMVASAWAGHLLLMRRLFKPDSRS
jgi:hypothetical protein